jgi:hypothetical protein
MTELSFSRHKLLSLIWDTDYEQQNMLQTLHIIKCKQPKFSDAYSKFLVWMYIYTHTYIHTAFVKLKLIGILDMISTNLNC